MRNYSKKILGALLALLLFSNSSVAFAAESWYRTDGRPHGDVSFEDMKCEEINKEECEALVDKIIKDSSIDNNEETVLADYDAIIEMYDYLSTQSSLNSIRYYNDPTNKEYSKIDSELSEYTTFWLDLACVGVKEVTKSQYADALKAHIDNESLYGMFEAYEEMTEDESVLLKEENALVQQYDELAVGDFDTYKEKNELAVPIFIELVKNRNKQAKEAGYDNYAEYAYDSLYVRDYTLEGVKEFYKNVKRYIVPIYEDIARNYDWEDVLEDYAPDQDEQLALMKPYLKEIDPELDEAFDYMVDHNLCDLKDSETKLPVGYTDTFYYYNAPFILNCPEANWYRVETLIHEFGHYNQAYHTDDHAISASSNMDVAEIDSQGLEVLFLKYADKMYGEENADDVRIQILSNLLGAVIDGCLYDEFQYRVYSSKEELTPEKVNEIFVEVSNEYGDYYTLEDDNAYYWVEITHTFESPMYYISYATSAISALDIFAMSIKDYDAACDKYMELTSYGVDVPYCELIDEVGLRNPFYARDVRNISKVLSEYTDDLMSPDYSLIIIGAIIEIVLFVLFIVIIVVIAKKVAKMRKEAKKLNE